MEWMQVPRILMAGQPDGLDVALLAVGILLAFAVVAAAIAQIVVMVGYWKGNRTQNSLGLTGGDCARQLLDREAQRQPPRVVRLPPEGIFGGLPPLKAREGLEERLARRPGRRSEKAAVAACGGAVAQAPFARTAQRVDLEGHADARRELPGRDLPLAGHLLELADQAAHEIIDIGAVETRRGELQLQLHLRRSPGTGQQRQGSQHVATKAVHGINRFQYSNVPFQMLHDASACATNIVSPLRIVAPRCRP